MMKAFQIDFSGRIMLLSLSLVCFLLVGGSEVQAQPGPNDPPQIAIPLTLTAGESTFDDLVMGLDVRATAGYDDVAGLGEIESLPDFFSPSIEGRFTYTGSTDQTYKDFRFASGLNVTAIHLLEFQKDSGDNTNSLTISWEMPGYVTGQMKDLITGTIIDVTMTGDGSVEIPTTTQGTLQVNLVEITLNYVNIPPELLPVEMKSFDAVAEGNTAVLLWETANELNNAGFEVQQETEAGFETIGFVEGAGTTLDGASYRYEVNNLDAGAHTFRLKQVDFDGAFEYSDLVTAIIGLSSPYVFSQPYPNPFNPQTQFTVAVSRDQEVALHVYNLLGERVATLFEGELSANNAHRFTFEAGALPSGRYFIHAQGAYFNSVRSITLLK